MNTTRPANVSVLTAMAGCEVKRKLTQQHNPLFFNIICQIFLSFRKAMAGREQRHRLYNS